MTRDNRDKYGGKHRGATGINPDIAEQVMKRMADGRLPCAAAFKIAEGLDVDPAEVGVALDLLEIKISKCQMGIFGYGKGGRHTRPMESVPASLESAIRESYRQGRLACRDAWHIAGQLDTGRMDVAAACDILGIKIAPCQLGAF